MGVCGEEGCVSDSDKTTATKRQQCNVDLKRRHTREREFDNDDNDGLQKDVVSAMMEGLFISLSLSLFPSFSLVVNVIKSIWHEVWL